MTHEQLLVLRNDYLKHIREVAKEAEEEPKKQAALAWAKNIVGTGVGLKITGGKILLDTRCVVVFVRKKILGEFLGKYSLEEFLGNKRCVADDQKVNRKDFDFVEVGSFRGASAAQPRSRRPLDTIINIGADLTTPFSADHATLCTFVRKKNVDPSPVYFLSALHGVDGHEGLYKEVVSGGDVIGDIHCAGEVFPGDCVWEDCPTHPDYRQLDVVVCKLRTEDFTPRFDLPGGGHLSPQPGEIKCREEVLKAGGTVRTGIIHSTNICATVDFPSQTACLSGQFVICSDLANGLPFSLPGDSGSLIVTYSDRNHRKALGMLVAAGDPVSLLGDEGELPLNFSIATPISPILKKFDLELLVKYNPEPMNIPRFDGSSKDTPD
jgi:hypothetical protein